MLVSVYVNNHDRTGRVVSRKVVQATLIEARPHTLLVELPDGKRIVRKKGRDVPDADK